MRSLVLLSEYSQRLSRQPLCVAHDAVENQLYAASIDQDTIYIEHCTAQVPSGQTEVTLFTPLAAIPLPSPTDSHLKVWLSYLSDSEALCLALAGGDIFHVFLDGTVEKMGVLDSGILALAWSHDESVLALVNGMGHIVLLTHHFHPLTEFPLETTELGEQAQVALGWGKKETQFHGSLGKQAAKKQTEIPEGIAPSDDLHPHISWRGDDAYFVVSGIDSCQKRRCLRIYSKEGVLQSTSEPIGFLEHTLAWKPSGALIASSQVQGHQHLIVFLERNGLKHGEFPLPAKYKDARILHLAWNLDAGVLLVWMRALDVDLLQLWTCSNYFWQLQQCIELESVQHVQWDLKNPLRLYVVTADRCFKYQFAFHMLTSPRTQVAAVCVVDTFKVRHTPFLRANIPPPYSQSEVFCDLPIKAVAFSQDSERSENLAILAGWHGHDILLCGPSATQEGHIEVYSRYKIPKIRNMTLRQPFYPLNDQLVFVAFLHEEESDALVYVDLNASGVLQVSEPHVLSFNVYLLCPISVQNEPSLQFCIQDTVGQVWKICFVQKRFVIEPWLRLPEFPADTMGVDSSGNMISLTNKAKLYFNMTLLCSDCLSFAIYADTLFYTTMHHQLVFQRKNQSSTRTVELGAKLVVASSTSVVLQMPRGNLETVYPRMLLFDALTSHLKARQWRASFQLCRSHRLDFNVLVDVDPMFFIHHLSEFITQLGKADDLNLFLSHLKNENSLVSKEYSVLLPQRENLDGFFHNKVNTLCDATRKVLCELHLQSSWVSSYLTTFVKKQPPEIEAALDCLRNLSLADRESALKYLVFLVDVSKLMDVALGMYGLDLYLLVAQASHSDPREYLALLEKLKAMPETYRRFTIDHTLQRHSKAFGHLLQLHATHWDELVAYMRLHRFYRLALQHLTGEKRKQVLIMYAQDLYDQGKYLEAGQCYTQAGEDSRAIDMFERAGAWKQALSLAKKIGIPDEAFQDLVDVLVEHLIDEANWFDIGQIYHVYLHDVKKAVQYWIEGGFWVDAIRIIHLYGEPQLPDSLVVPSLQKSIESTLASLVSYSTDVRNRVDRLIELHQEQANAQKHKLTEESSSASTFEGGLLDNVDVMTETGSVKTTFTGQTLMTGAHSATGSMRSGKTAKSRRKQERKRHLGKKGSPYEESYLYDSIRKLALRCTDFSHEVKQLIQALFLITTETFDVIQSAQQLQSGYENMLKELKLDLDRVAEDTSRLPASNPKNFSSDKGHVLERTDSAVLNEDVVEEVDRSVPKIPETLDLNHDLLLHSE